MPDLSGLEAIAGRMLPLGIKDFGRHVMIKAALLHDRGRNTDSFVSHLARIIHRLRINCVVDVGAHVGQYGRILRALGYKGRICSFEPVDENYATLQRRAAGDPEWLAYRMALADRAGRMEIKVAATTHFSSFLQRNAFSGHQYQHHSATVRTETVDVNRLDSVIDVCVRGVDRPRILLKTDTQGYDIEVLKGATKTLESAVALQCELSVTPIYHDQLSYIEALTFIGHLGFELSGIYAQDRAASMQIVELDCLMVRGSRMDDASSHAAT